MTFLGRTRELGALRGLLDRRSPQVVHVTGIPGVGKSVLVRRAASDYDGVAVTCPPLPDPAIRAAVGTGLRGADAVSGPKARGGSESEELSSSMAEWSTLLASALDMARSASRPWVLVLDDAHRLTEARSRWIPALRTTLDTASAEGVTLHVVLAGRASGLPDEPEATTLALGPLPCRIAAKLLPGGDARARLRAYGIFGGIPRVLTRLDPSVTAGTNVRRLVLHPDGPLAQSPIRWLEQEVQTASRYVAILRALSLGPADWGTVHAGVPDLTRSGQVAPYLARLVEMGLVDVRTPLDAPAGSRSRRYALTDPFLTFWCRFVLPWRAREQIHGEAPGRRGYYTAEVRPAISAHMESIMPDLALQHVARDARETLGAPAREYGALWGPDLDIPLAGILSSGAAFYGTSVWSEPKRGSSPVADLDRQIRETRYGFGRERRLRVVFTGTAAPTWLRREVARRPDAELIEPDAMLAT